MRPLLSASLLAALAANQALARQGQAYKGFDPKRDAAADIRRAVATAKKQNKRILIDVVGNWCGWCKKVDAFFESDKESKALLQAKYILVRVNMSPENTNEKVLKAYPKAEGYPHLYVLDKNGKFLHSQGTGALETGDHHDRDKVLAFLKKWAA